MSEANEAPRRDQSSLAFGLARFRNLILEEAAEICDQRAAGQYNMMGDEARICAALIRKLKDG